MKRIIRCFIALSLAWVCFAPNLIFGIEKGNTVLVGMIEWTEVTEPDYGIRFFLPEGMETAEIENDPFEALVGQTEDGITMVIQGTPQSVKLSGLEEWVVEDLEIDSEDFDLIDSEDSFHNDLSVVRITRRAGNVSDHGRAASQARFLLRDLCAHTNRTAG